MSHFDGVPYAIFGSFLHTDLAKLLWFQERKGLKGSKGTNTESDDVFILSLILYAVIP